MARKVLVAPCYGNPKSRRRYHETIMKPVHFADAAVVDLLSQDQRTALLARHPDGFARFWGARAVHDNMMKRLSPGDVVLFTGDNKVKASADIAYLFQNERLADQLWRHTEQEDTFVHVYSVLNVRHLELPKEELLALEGFSPADPLAGQRILRDEQAQRVLDTFGIATGLADDIAAEEVAASQRRSAEAKLIAVERMHVSRFERNVVGGRTVAERAESELVLNYRLWCYPELLHSLRTPSNRRTDLFRRSNGEVEVIEAKSSATHEKVREAVAQLLDYAVHSTPPVTRLTALFPRVPNEEGLAFLHRLGIDCVHAYGDGFTRLPAPSDRRARMQPIWRGE